MKIKRSFKFMFLIIILIVSILPHFSFAAEGINTVLILKEAIATWYYLIRTISIAIMLLVLIFIGIKMATTTIASDKAFFQRMLFDWVAGMILVFGIHYIMIFILELNETIIDMVSNTAQAIYEAEPSEYGGIENQSKTNDDIEVSIFDTIRTRAYDPKLINGTTGMVMYIYLVYYAYKFTFIYFKRYLTVALLTLMAPAVAVSYALSKALSGKTKIFSKWLKEYFFNVILQSIHAIIYVTFVLSALKLSLNSISGMLLSFILLNFMSKADKIFRKIFNIGGNGSLVDDIADKDVGKELFENVKGIANAYMGNKALKKIAKWERKKLFYKPAQKAFGAVMAYSRNNEIKNNYKKDDAGNETAFTEDEFNEFENNENVQAILNKEAEIDLLKDELNKTRERIRINRKKRKNLTEQLKQKNDDKDIKNIRAELVNIENDLQEDEELEENQEVEIDAKEKDLQIAMDQFANSKFALKFAFKQKIKDTFDPKKYTEYDEQKGKYVGAKTKYKGKYVKDENGNLIYVPREKLTLAEKIFSEDALTVDSIGMRMRENINAQTVLGMTEEDKKILSENVKEMKNVVVGFFSGFFSMAMFIENPVVGAGLFANMGLSAGEVFSEYRKKNHAKFSLPAGFEADEGLTVEEVKFIRREMTKQLNTAKDDYIVESITKKNKKFVKLLAKGAIVATGSVAGAKFIRGTQTRKNGLHGTRLTRTGGFGYTEREHVLNQFYKQDDANRKVEKLILSRNDYNMALETAGNEIEKYNKSLEERQNLFREAALDSNNVIDINGMLIPTNDDISDEDKMTSMLEAKLQQSSLNNMVIAAAAGMTIEEFARELISTKEQDQQLIGEFNGVQVNTESYTSEQEIIDALSNSVSEKIADGNSENANTTVVRIDDKQLLVTDKMIENAILTAAANSKKSISEFTSEKTSFKEIEEQLELEVFGKDNERPENASQEISKAVGKRLEMIKTKMVISEATTDSFREIISEKGITNTGDISVTEVENRVSNKLEDWVKVNPNSTASVLDNIAQQRQALDSSSVSDTKKLAQSVLGGKSIEEVASSAVQARHQAITSLNRKDAGSSISEETAKKLKENLEEKHRKEFQQLLIAVTQEQDEKKLQELLSSVPEAQAESAYLVLDLKRHNLEADRLKIKGKKAKHLTFELDSSNVLGSLSNMAKDLETTSVKTPKENIVEDNYDSSVKEQDTRVKEQNTRTTGDGTSSSASSKLNSTDIMTSKRRSGTITSKEINSDIEEPLRDLASLIDSIGKNR